MTFGEKLVTLRKEAGLSQEGLAEKLSVSRQAVSRWENEGILPDCGNLLELSRLFGVSADYLLNDDYRSDGDLPAVRLTKAQLEGEKKHQGMAFLLGGLHAVFFLLAMGIWAVQPQWADFLAALCAAASLGDILFTEAWFRSGKAPAEEVSRLRRSYYRLGVWFFAWFPVRWFCAIMLRVWIRPINFMTVGALTVAVWLLVCCGVWWAARGKK